VILSTDHLAVLRYAAPLGPELLEAVEDACIGAEIAASQVSQPTPGAQEFLAACHREEKPVVIVSNNAAEAVHAYLLRLHLHCLVRGVVGRHPRRPDLMKPHPSLVGAALDVLGQRARHCVMIGDSVTDVEAAASWGIATVGFAKTPQRGRELSLAGAAAVITSMEELSGSAL
jgi:phosphoglycolate phosphatase